MERVNEAELVTAVPVMTRNQKLQRWADLIRAKWHRVYLWSNLEYMRKSDRDAVKVYGSDTAFALAAADKEFQAQGLSSNATITGVMDFFEISLDDAHKFSCDCGGEISNDQQARRIEQLIR